MLQSKIDRINALTRISRQRALTEEETVERALLREEYIAAFRRNLASQLDNIYFKEKDGTVSKLKMKGEADE